MKSCERLSLEQALAYQAEVDRHATAVIRRLRRVASLPERPCVLDIGSAQGHFLIACARLACDVVGVEPWDQARTIAAEVAKRFATEITIVDGTAESLPFRSESFDIVHANSVIEHVVDVEAALREAVRVLKPGGLFWFSSASSMCPRQHEITAFPAFGWYPDPLKRRIMQWASNHRPELIWHTAAPAIHWFTPWKARRLLREAGFSKVYDRWDLRLPEEGGVLYSLTLRLIRSHPVTKLVADVAVPDCSYAAIK